MLKTNRDRLVMLSVQGEISHPGMRAPYRNGFDGVNRVVPGTGGITYNVRVGDSCFGLAADHVEPAVSSKNKDEVANMSYNTLSCVGNTAYVISGDAKGAKGVVTGKHGGIEHVLIDFAPEVLDKMVIGDKIQIRSFGQGLELAEFPGVTCQNIDPDFLEKMGIRAAKGKLEVPVAAVAPAVFMGSGLGAATAYTGDYDITTMDPAALSEAGLDKLRFGDIVAIADASSKYGRFYHRGSVIIGIVVHSNSMIAGHGPGVTSLLTADAGEIVPVIKKNANIADILKLR